MARTVAELPRGARITDYISLGVVASRFPADEVRAVLAETGRVLMAHFAMRGLMHEAALKADQDPDRLSYLHAVRVIRRKLPLFVAIPPPGDRKMFHERVLDEILQDRLPPRQGRRNARAVKRKASKGPTRLRQSRATTCQGLRYTIKILK